MGIKQLSSPHHQQSNIILENSIPFLKYAFKSTCTENWIRKRPYNFHSLALEYFHVFILKRVFFLPLAEILSLQWKTSFYLKSDTKEMQNLKAIQMHLALERKNIFIRRQQSDNRNLQDYQTALKLEILCMSKGITHSLWTQSLISNNKISDNS